MTSPPAGTLNETKAPLRRANGQGLDPRSDPLSEANSKQCTRCHTIHPKTYFWKAGQNKDRLSSWCKSCTKEHRNKWRRDNPEKQRLSQRRCYVKTKWGLTLEDYDALMAAPCAICGGPSKHLDHNHDTGEIREALCGLCNQAIGLFGEDTDRMQAALAYLEKHE